MGRAPMAASHAALSGQKAGLAIAMASFREFQASAAFAVKLLRCEKLRNERANSGGDREGAS